MALSKLQIIRSDVPTDIHKDVKQWSYENKINGKSLNTEKKMYSELIKLGHQVYAEKIRKIER